jgi:hypothetical protein
VGLRYTRKETYTRIGRAVLMKTPPRTQVLFQLSKGLEGLFGGQLSYTKAAVQFSQRFQTRWFGRTALQLELAKVWGDVPYAYLFQTHGIKQPDRRTGGLFIGNSFQTVGLYEFTSSAVATLFLQQNFGTLLFRPKNIHIRPEFVLVNNISVGKIEHPGSHAGTLLQAPAKGIFETGLLANDLYRVNLRFFYLGVGAGVFRRYGYYTLPTEKDNWAFPVWFQRFILG